MFKRFKQTLDRWAIGAASTVVASGNRPAALKENTERILKSSSYLSVADVTSARLNFSDHQHFTFPSFRNTGSVRNDLAHGRFFPAPHRPQGTVLLVHGWNAELHYSWGLPKIARSLNQQGLNALLLELPFHAQRRPRDPNLPHNFISEDIPLMLSLVEQSLADFEALLKWSIDQTSQPAALWGFSLGAWLAGLHCTVSQTATAAVLTTPVSRLDLAIAHLAFCEPIRRALGAEQIDISTLNLSHRSIQLEPRNVLVVESDYDVFVPASTIAELLEAWKGIDHFQVPQSHVSILTSGEAIRSTVSWLKDHLQRQPVYELAEV